MTILKFPLSHIQMECNSSCCNGSCYACCLAVCKVCMAFEGSLTSHCVGRRLTQEEQDKVYNEGWDFINNKWIQDKDKHLMDKKILFK